MALPPPPLQNAGMVPSDELPGGAAPPGTEAPLDAEAQRQALLESRAADRDVVRLQTMSCAELQQIAADEQLPLPPGLSTQELVFEILRARLQDRGLGYANGVLEVLADGFGFLRSPAHDYEPGPDDVYVSPSQIRRLNLKPGHWLAGPVRPPGRGEKYFALQHVDLINGADAEVLQRRVPFASLLPVLPRRRLWLSHPDCGDEVRMIELLCPWGYGQRVLIQAPPGSGRTLLLTRLLAALAARQPELYQIVCLVDERPEDVTEVRRTLGQGPQREVVGTSFDQAPGRHVALCDMALQKAMRMVESGRDVVLALDSLTRLVRACAQDLPHSGKVLTAGLDSGALQRAKRLFGAARQTEGGGSLTVLATELVGTDSRLDQVIAEEFTNKGNSEVVLDRELAELHAWPALDVLKSSTRREDCLLAPTDVDRLRRLRLQLSELTPRARLQHLAVLLAGAEDHDALLRQLP